ncbi:MAG: NlpC/P60 family protein [Actinomycetota bacterium]
MKRSTSIRHAVLAAAIAAAGISTALPTSAHAFAVEQGRRIDDPVAQQASQALALLNEATETGDAKVQAAYEKARAEIAVAIAARIGSDVLPLSAAWANADVVHQRALMAALGQLGVPYRRNTSKPGVSFDCSGLTTYAWAQAGYSLQRSSAAQIRTAAAITIETAQAGDLVYYPGHISMWLGVDRAMVHSPQTGRTVEVDVFSAKKRLRFADPTI